MARYTLPRSLSNSPDVIRNERRRQGSYRDPPRLVRVPLPPLLFAPFPRSSLEFDVRTPPRSFPALSSPRPVSRIRMEESAGRAVDFSGGGRCIFDILSGGSQDGGKGRGLTLSTETASGE